MEDLLSMDELKQLGIGIEDLDTDNTEEFVPFRLELLEVLPRDVFLYLSGYLDDDTAVALCQVNKNFYNHICGSNFWRNKIMQRYNVTRAYIDRIKGNNTYYSLYQYLIPSSLVASLRRTQRGTSFKSPVLLSEDMINFLRDPETDFGLSDPNDPTSIPLKEALMTINNGISSKAIITPLMGIYAHVNQMRKDPTNKLPLTSTEAMDRHLQSTYERLTARPQKYTKPDRHTGVSQPIPKFDPKHFRYMDMHSIVHENTVKNEKLSPYHQELFQDLGLAKLLDHDRDLVNNALSIYRDRAKAAEMAAEMVKAV